MKMTLLEPPFNGAHGVYGLVANGQDFDSLIVKFVNYA